MLRDLPVLGTGLSRSISPENITGAKGSGGMASEGTGAWPGRDLGRGWKISPSIEVDAESTIELGLIEGPATITHLWLTTDPIRWRSMVLRVYWDGRAEPAIAVPLGDFFGQGWERFAQ